MSEERAARVGEEMQREIARMLSTGKIKDPRIGFVTITAVKLTSDLREAKVYFVIHGTDAEKRETTDGLMQSAGKIRAHLGKVMKIHHAPHVKFLHDKSIDEGEKIERILQEVRTKEGR